MLENYYDGGQHGVRFGDLNWILEQVDKLPINMQPEVKAKYSVIYNELLETDKNQVRYRANTWLRKVVKKYAVIVDKNELMF